MCMHRRQSRGLSTCTGACVVLFFWYIKSTLDVRKSNNLCWFIFSMWHLNNMILIKRALTNKAIVQQKSSSVLSCYSSVLCSPLMSDPWKWKKTTHREMGKKEGIHCRGSARGFCSVYPILNSSYLYYIIEVRFLAALQIICISALWYKRLPHWLGSFYIFSALMFLWHTYLCKIQGFGGPSRCSSRFIATR